MNPGPTSRRRARELLLRVLYQAEATSDPVSATWGTVETEERLSPDSRTYAGDLCRGVDERGPEIDAVIRRHLEHWSFERLGATDRSVLRLATAELLIMRGTPARVILDEAVDIARKFGQASSGPFVNGVLDRVARELRPGELEEEAEVDGRGA